jgi:mRNA-degrading endonuclease RelE of RelBE toxin-antitoxin system
MEYKIDYSEQAFDSLLELADSQEKEIEELKLQNEKEIDIIVELRIENKVLKKMLDNK